MGGSGFLNNESGSEWFGLDFYIIKMSGSGFLYNENGSEWLGVVWSGSEHKMVMPNK